MVHDWLGPVVGAGIAAGFVVNAIRDWRNGDVPWWRLVGSTGAGIAMLAAGLGMRGQLLGPMIFGVIMLPISALPTRTAIRLFAPRKALVELAREGESWALPEGEVAKPATDKTERDD